MTLYCSLIASSFFLAGRDHPFAKFTNEQHNAKAMQHVAFILRSFLPNDAISRNYVASFKQGKSDTIMYKRPFKPIIIVRNSLKLSGLCP